MTLTDFWTSLLTLSVSVCLSICLSVCVSVSVAPSPNNVQPLTSNHCRDRRHHPTEWFYTRPRPGNCERIPELEHLYDASDATTSNDHRGSRKDALTADDIVFVFQFPNPRDGRELAMSRLHQTMLSVFTLSISFDDSYSAGK